MIPSLTADLTAVTYDTAFLFSPDYVSNSFSNYRGCQFSDLSAVFFNNNCGSVRATVSVNTAKAKSEKRKTGVFLYWAKIAEVRALQTHVPQTKTAKICMLQFADNAPKVKLPD